MNINNINTNKVVVKTSNISKIKIPMIQRDYVQGLDEKKLVPFLNTLIDTLLNGQKLSLDFIYGNINEDGVFEPIDGQQRLTTLALLTFYLYCRQKGSDNNKTLNNPFKLITYATRQSAKKFCELLSKDEFKDKFDNSVVPSNVIKKNPKYFSEYDEDTTISAMLKTLDKIHEIICKENIDINGLIKHIDNITFQIFPMESFNLSDDLYIKMNGRGKQLSSFDNFKADYFKWLEESNNNIDNLISNIIESNGDDKLETLKRKFNTDYIDIFWDYAFENSKDTNEAPDPEKLFFRFINRFIVGKYLLLTNKAKKEFDKEFEETFFDKDGIKSEKDKVEFKKMNVYEHILKINDNNKKLINILENLLKLKKCKKDIFKAFLSDIFTSSWKEKIDIFTNNVKERALSMQKVLIFNTIISYFETDNLSIESIENNLKSIARITWNIAEQFNIYTAPTLINRDNYHIPANKLSFISKVENNYVYDSFMREYDDFISEFNIDSEQNELIEKIIYDELVKCRMIINDKNNIIENKLRSLESLDYLHGITGFLLLDDNNDFEANYQHYLNIFNNIDKVSDKDKKYNINNSNKLLVRLLIYELYKSNKYTIDNKYFSDTFIRKELIGNTVFKKHMLDLIMIIKEDYEFNLPKIDESEIKSNGLNRVYNPYFKDSLISILYDKINNNYVVNEYYIDTSVTPCIEHNTYLNKPYKKFKRLGSIIVEQHVCDMVNYITSKTVDGIKFNNDEEPKKINYSCEDNSKKREAYKHLIYYNNGHLIIYFNIKDRRYSVWFIYQDNQIGITDETDQDNKKELKKQYSNDNFNEEDFKTDIDTIKQIIEILLYNNKTLADLYDNEISNGFYKR